MSAPPIVQYKGFETKDSVRVYIFSIREGVGEPREYKLTIASEAFVTHRVRYQDAPEICSSRLQREIAAGPDHLFVTTYCITDAELEDYRTAHRIKIVPSPYARKPARAF